jgi:putative membrane protein
MEIPMTPVARRAVLFAMAAVPVASGSGVFAVDALPDARFVGFAQTVNDFEIASGRLALVKSTNENVRGYATRMVADHTEAVEYLRKSRAEAGVSYAPDPSSPPDTVATLQRLNALEVAEFDTAYANSQLAVQTQAAEQYGAYSQNGDSGPLRRYAQMMLPKAQQHLEYARRLAGGR